MIRGRGDLLRLRSMASIADEIRQTVRGEQDSESTALSSCHGEPRLQHRCRDFAQMSDAACWTEVLADIRE